MTHHVIYVPGLGDYKPRGQELVPKYWQLFGVKGHYFAMNWRDKEDFSPKLKRLLAMIDGLAKDGNQVSLVGTSAGASAALVAYAARQNKVSGVVCICGKINHPETIDPARFAENPAFEQSLAELQHILSKFKSEARSRILSIRPLHDTVVPPGDTIIPGTCNKLVLAAGHVFSIFVILIFGARATIRFLQKQSKR